ncbi:hypothetical protein N8273_02175 [Algibacter sp.]|nr:hypothetical protein [Algibacter sp.]
MQDHSIFAQIMAMNGLDIVMVFAIILFARLGIRLVSKYIKMKKEDKNQ